MFPRRQTVLLFTLFLALVPRGSEAASQRTFRDLTLPLYVDHVRTPVAVLKVRHSTRDHLQKGFFKFGVFPILKLDRLAIDVYHPEEGKNVFDQATATLSKLRPPGQPGEPGAKRRPGITGVEVEQFELRVLDQRNVRLRLTADFASKFGTGHWKLRDGKLTGRGEEQSFARATLEITDRDIVLHRPAHADLPLFTTPTENVLPSSQKANP